jgi:hypothetical protein
MIVAAPTASEGVCAAGAERTAGQDGWRNHQPGMAAAFCGGLRPGVTGSSPAY